MRISNIPNRVVWGLGALIILMATQNCQCQLGNSFNGTDSSSQGASTTSALLDSSPSFDRPTTASLVAQAPTASKKFSLLDLTTESSVLKLDPRMAHELLLADTRQRSYLKIDMQGAKLDQNQRPPLNVALVLDRSGSMAGEKLAQAKQAVAMVLGTLREDDRVSIITYDNTVQIIAYPTQGGQPESLIQKVNRIQTGGSTNLYDGVSTGATLLKSHQSERRINRLVLLSDGLANAGRVSIDDMQELGSRLGRQGISVTTIGLGMDYDHRTLTALAVRSEGNHFFARNAQDLEEGFGLEFSKGMAVVASDVQIRVRLNPDVRLLDVLNASPSKVEGQEILIHRRQLWGNHKAFLLLEVDIPSREDGEEMDLAQVRVDFTNMLNGKAESLATTARVRFSDSKDKVRDSEQQDVMVAVAGVLANRQATEARRLYEAGRVEEAKLAFASTAKQLAEQGRRYNSKQLRDFGQLNASSAQNLTKEKMKTLYQHESLATFGQSNMGSNPY
ncbi:MAG: VWA domain-containing protein [Deltaproteobacteria bacterium]|nr:VWA domain-containing protein [Deltaproteobacteria bacterium]